MIMLEGLVYTCWIGLTCIKKVLGVRGRLAMFLALCLVDIGVRLGSLAFGRRLRRLAISLRLNRRLSLFCYVNIELLA